MARRSAWIEASAQRAVARAEPPRTNRELRDLSLARIYEAALSRFVDNGYLATTVDQIAADAGLTKGGVYFYIGKKERLLLQMINRIRREYVDDFLSRNNADPGKHAQDRLVALIHWQVNYARDHPREIMLMITLSSEGNAELATARAAVLETYQMLYGYLERLIDEGRRSGEFRTHLKTRELASFYMAAHDGMMLEWYRRREEIDGSELVRVYRELMLRAVTER